MSVEPHLRAVPDQPSHLRVIDGNGEVADDATILPEDYANLWNRNKRLEREIAGLKGELTKLRRVDPKLEDIMEVLEYWRDRTNHPGAKLPVDGKRFKSVKTRLNDGFSTDQLKRAIDGVAAFPYEGDYGKRYAENDKGRKRKDELILHVMRDEQQVEARIRLAAGDGPVRAYRGWLHKQCQAKPNLCRTLAFLASEHTPHGSVLASAAIYYGKQTL